MAGLIPQAFIDTLLDRINIVDVIDRRVPLKKAGRSYMACCPFHQEKSPSFSVSLEKQFYHCFGCGAHGNAIGFLMAYEGLDFPSVIEILAGSIGLDVPKESVSTQGAQGDSKQKELSALLSQAAKFYQNCLLTNPKAEGYLDSRGLSPSIIEDFSIGYAPASWDALMKHMLSVGWSTDELLESGMIIRHEGGERYYDRFRDRIMFPIRDIKGRYIAFGGRVIGNEKPKYLNSPETALFSKGRELFGLYEVNNKHKGRLARLLVVEGYMDVVALAQFGITNAVAALGTAMGSSQIEKGFRYCDEIVFCFDGDQAGQRAAWKAMVACLPLLVSGKGARFLFLPDGQDPDSYLRGYGVDAFLAQIELASPLSTYLFESLGGGLLLDTAEGRSVFITKAIQELCRIPEGVYRRQLLMELALRGQTDLGFLERLISDMGTEPEGGGTRSAVQTDVNLLDPFTDGGADVNLLPGLSPIEQAADVLQRSVAKILMVFPEWATDVLRQLQVDVNPTDQIQGGWLVALVTLIAQYPDASSSRLLGAWHASHGNSAWAEILSEILNNSAVCLDRGAAERELGDALARLMLLWRRDVPLDRLIAISKQRELTEVEKQQLRMLLTG